MKIKSNLISFRLWRLYWTWYLLGYEDYIKPDISGHEDYIEPDNFYEGYEGYIEHAILGYKDYIEPAIFRIWRLYQTS